MRHFDYIAVGNGRAAPLAKTGMAKSVLDAGWSTFRQQLAYKAVRQGAWYAEVSERFSAQLCSHCGALPDERLRVNRHIPSRHAKAACRFAYVLYQYVRG